jgi:hypothetical protein
MAFLEASSSLTRTKSCTTQVLHLRLQFYSGTYFIELPKSIHPKKTPYQLDWKPMWNIDLCPIGIHQLLQKSVVFLANPSDLIRVLQLLQIPKKLPIERGYTSYKYQEN